MFSDPFSWITAPRRALLLVAGVCVFALTGALIAQYGLGLPPCILCTWQRIPYAVIVTLALIGLLPFMPQSVVRLVLALAAIGFLVEMGIAVFHMGVENHWWEGTAECTSDLDPNLSLEDLKKAIMSAPPARCDEVGWTILGISITVWNTGFSLVAAAFAGFSALRGGK